MVRHGGEPAAGRFRLHNGEGIYVGTSPKTTNRSMHADDNTSYNLIENNVIHTYGSECLDVKENSHDNVFSYNDCGFNDEPLAFEGSNIEIRGYHNTVTDNTIANSLGYGVKLASDSTIYPQGKNVVTGNLFSGDVGSSIYNRHTTAQGAFCGDSFKKASYLQGSSVGLATKACPAVP